VGWIVDMSEEEYTKFYAWSNSLFEIWYLDNAPLGWLLFFVILLMSHDLY
jgi:hypothetical protein